MSGEIVSQIAIWALPVLMAVVFHEVAHGWVANRLGDATAARAGRLTLNPLSHIDPFGTVLLPALLIITGAPFVFGYAKPVPVNFHNLRRPKRDMILVAGAGPATNILLAVASFYILKAIVMTGGSSAALPGFVGDPVALIAESSIAINVMLAAFNLLPIPPLDGGRVLVGLLPDPYASMVARVEPFGFLIIIVLLMTHTVDILLRPMVQFLIGLVRALVWI